jgi:hypothetical protein
MFRLAWSVADAELKGDVIRRLTVTLACGLAMVWAPSVAVAQNSQTSTATASGQAASATLPVCGQRATTSTARRSTSTATRAKSRRRKTTGSKRTRASKRRKRATSKSRTKARKAKPSAGEPVRATLTLDQEDQETVSAATFGRTTDPQPLTLVYRVSGCRVTDTLPWPRSPLPTGPVNTAGARALPLGAVQIDDVEAEDNRYVVYLRVFVSSRKASDQGGAAKPAGATTPKPNGGQAAPTAAPDGTPTTKTTGNTPNGAAGAVTSAATSPPDEFNVGPGSYTSFVRIKAPWMRTVATPVTVTRSEDSEWIPLGFGVLGGLCGFFVFWLLRKIHDDDLLVKETWVLWLAAIVSVVVGAGTAFVTNYFNQEVWTVEANALALFIAAFSASTGGVAAGLLTGIYKTSAANAAAGGGGGGAGGGGPVAGNP